MTALEFKAEAEELINQLSDLIDANLLSKGLKEPDCQRLCLNNRLSDFAMYVNGTKDSDFEENEDS